MNKAYNIVPQKPTPLWQLGARHFSEHDRRQRVAIDAPPLIGRHIGVVKNDRKVKSKTRVVVSNLYYHALHLKRAGIDAVFVFNGVAESATHPQSYVIPPPATAGAGVKGSSFNAKGKSVEKVEDVEYIDYQHVINEFKEVLRQLRIPIHAAQNDTIAECSAMNKAGLVDAVLTTDGNAFLFGAKVILRLEKTDKKVVLVYEFIPGDLAASAPGKHLNQKALLAMALLAGEGNHRKKIFGCGTDLAIQIGRSHHGDKLWDIFVAQESDTRETLLRDWVNRLADDLKTNPGGHFTSKRPAVAKSLPAIATSSTLRAISRYMAGIHMEIPERDETGASWEEIWNGEVDVSALKEFTREHFDWNDTDDSFFRNLAPALLPSYVSSGREASGMISSLDKPRSNDNGPCLMIKFRLNHIAGGESSTGNHGTSGPEQVPEWLVRQACPSSYQKWVDSQQGPSKKTPKRKVSSTQATIVSGQKRARREELKGPGPIDSFVIKTPRTQTQPPGGASALASGAIISSPVAGPSGTQPMDRTSLNLSLLFESKSSARPSAAFEPRDPPASASTPELEDPRSRLRLPSSMKHRNRISMYISSTWRRGIRSIGS
ncbi:hypothetical protein PG997_012185 [Apiospora hydei]|uniref:XPG-I domain-containing protein n=1 Tax=Apiospora hydei TaxID=1337664 RepID=A0ABR1V2P1_9PEZI